jgi:hypothetical protein
MANFDLRPASIYPPLILRSADSAVGPGIEKASLRCVAPTGQ